MQVIDKSLVYYLAGPMRPLPDHNFPQFEQACKILRADGFKIVSPHEMGDPSMSRGQLMSEDIIALIFSCGGLIHLPDFEKSPGASAEVAVAFATEKPVLSATFTDYGIIVSPSKTMTVSVTREQQYAEGWPLVGLCGWAQAGKDTVATHLVPQGWTRVAFADTLREVLYALNPIVDCNFLYRGLSTASYKDGGPFVRVQDLVDAKGWDAAKTSKNDIRDLLQRLGTEAGRDILDQLVWVRKGEEKIELAGGPVVLTDCRFPNEVNMVRRRKGKLIWVSRPGVEPANAHASEHSVKQEDCDYSVINDGTIKQLGEQIDTVLMIDQGRSTWGNVSGIDSALTVSV